MMVIVVLVQAGQPGGRLRQHEKLCGLRAVFAATWVLRWATSVRSKGQFAHRVKGHCDGPSQSAAAAS